MIAGLCIREFTVNLPARCLPQEAKPLLKENNMMNNIQEVNAMLTYPDAVHTALSLDAEASANSQMFRRRSLPRSW